MLEEGGMGTEKKKDMSKLKPMVNLFLNFLDFDSRMSTIHHSLVYCNNNNNNSVTKTKKKNSMTGNNMKIEIARARHKPTEKSVQGKKHTDNSTCLTFPFTKLNEKKTKNKLSF